jgi:hypothetical protein
MELTEAPLGFTMLFRGLQCVRQVEGERARAVRGLWHWTVPHAPLHSRDLRNTHPLRDDYQTASKANETKGSVAGWPCSVACSAGCIHCTILGASVLSVRAP